MPFYEAMHIRRLATYQPHPPPPQFHHAAASVVPQHPAGGRPILHISYQTSVVADRGQTEKGFLSKRGGKSAAVHASEERYPKNRKDWFAGSRRAPDAQQGRRRLGSQAEVMDTTVAMRALGFGVGLGEDAQKGRSTADFGIAAATGEVAVGARLGLGFD